MYVGITCFQFCFNLHQQVNVPMEVTFSLTRISCSENVFFPFTVSSVSLMLSRIVLELSFSGDTCVGLNLRIPLLTPTLEMNGIILYVSFRFADILCLEYIETDCVKLPVLGIWYYT